MRILTRPLHRQILLLFLTLPALAQPLRADDALPAETLTRLEAATVFIKVDLGNDGASGTGFVVHTAGNTAYIATNHHVVEGEPAGGRRFGLARTPTITVVFGSGTPRERLARAIVVASAPRSDLAILKVTGVPDLPQPIDLAQEVAPFNTMTIYVFGFPLGELLATNKRNPAITVGKWSVSSIRRDERGEVATVQIGGDVTPGNSGGPVVDSKGRLVGIANATVRGRAIGFAIPASHLRRLLKGRLLDYALNVRQAGGAGFDIGVELGVFDPLDRLKGVSFYVVSGENAGVRKLAQAAGVRKIPLQRRGMSLAGRFTVPQVAGSSPAITFQAVYVDGDGTTFLSNPRVRKLQAAPVFAPPGPIVRPNPGLPPGFPGLPPGMPGLPPGFPPGGKPKKAEPLDRAALARALADLASNDFFRRKRALEQLIAARPEGDRSAVLKALEPLFNDQSPFIFGDGLKAYASWASDKDKAAQRIAKYLPDFFKSHEALEALRILGSKAEKALHPYLEGQENIVGIQVVDLLADIGTQDSVAALTKVANNNQLLSHFARRALDKIKQRQNQPKPAPAAPPGAP